MADEVTPTPSPVLGTPVTTVVTNDPKPGVQTTEFWLTALTAAFGGSSQFASQLNSQEKGLVLALASLAVAVYTVGRSIVKS